MSEAILRPARPEDAAPLAALAYDTFRETFLDGFAIPYPPADLARFVAETYDPAVLALKLADPDQAAWVVEDDGAFSAYAMVGSCTLPHLEARSGHGELKRLYVRRTAQGAALGRRLMDVAMDWMRAERPGPVWIGVWSGNLRAQQFYERYGFRKVGAYQFPVGEWLDDEFIMRR